MIITVQIEVQDRGMEEMGIESGVERRPLGLDLREVEYMWPSFDRVTNEPLIQVGLKSGTEFAVYEKFDSLFCIWQKSAQ